MVFGGRAGRVAFVGVAVRVGANDAAVALGQARR
ncbi:hypothetical protein Ae168Ps1_3423c [Pseudonocardia sp. Ae168_Ps1]|nr:hypothetical protein Ae168Ps1_3423c [Pseudonocardia sp. Ae168_Ps1]OLL84867.1 hypothetical protein Ae263Ps1_1922 [Pseudonocardia sp. Ae263_Ps1]OLL95116.1 hypothetical protein Ae356Ps1_5013c [Pseudonocardia sp. Ae356_Ps1]